MFDEKLNDDEFALPRATVDKLIQKSNKNYMSKDARECIRAFSKRFLLLLTGKANKNCEAEKKENN